MSDKWPAFAKEFTEQLKVYLFAVIYFGLFRAVLILRFSDKMESTTDLGDIAQAMAHGFRFDSGIVMLFLLIPFFANLLLTPFGFTSASGLLRKVFSGLMLIAATLSFVVTLPYFAEYDNQFDYFLFELLYDDRSAIWHTLVEGYSVIPLIVIFLVVTAGCFMLLGKVHKVSLTPLTARLTAPRTLIARSTIVVAIMLLTIAAARGSFKSRPAMRKWADVTSDNFLNKTVMNPLKHLQYAYGDFKSINSNRRGISLLLGEIPIKTAAQEYFSQDVPTAAGNFLTDYLHKSAGGSPVGLPDHIFIIIMESYDAWPLMPKYAALEITDSLKALGAGGVFFDHFLPAGSSTMASLAAIISGLPHTGVNVSRIGAAGPPYATAAAPIFERLGYTTRLFYGGFLSWQNLGALARAQGIDETLAAPSIQNQFSGGIWGVDDEHLFDFALTQTTADEKTFNIILTTSYHPPFELDVRSKGFGLNEIPSEIQPYYDGSMTLQQLGHIWYGDREVGRFVRRMETQHPSTLFAITGDHYGRRFLNARPSVYEHTAVPLVIYGRQFLNPQSSRNTVPGSHLDIIPTIVELTAPAGFEYHSFGRSLLNPKASHTPRTVTRFALGHQMLIAENFIANLQFDSRPQPLMPADTVIDENLFRLLKTRHDQLLGLGWWYLFRGDSLGE